MFESLSKHDAANVIEHVALGDTSVSSQKYDSLPNRHVIAQDIDPCDDEET